MKELFQMSAACSLLSSDRRLNQLSENQDLNNYSWFCMNLAKVNRSTCCTGISKFKISLRHCNIIKSDLS